MQELKRGWGWLHHVTHETCCVTFMAALTSAESLITVTSDSGARRANCMGHVKSVRVVRCVLDAADLFGAGYSSDAASYYHVSLPLTAVPCSLSRILSGH